MTATNPAQSTASTFTISRTYDAPRDLVFDVYNNPEHMKHWWGPKGVKSKIAKMDFHVGEICHYCLTTPEGIEMWGKLTFQKIDVPNSVSCLVSFSDKDGNITTHPFVPNWPREVFATINFTETDGKTTLTVQWTPHNETPAERAVFDAGHDGMAIGWGGTLDQFGEYLETVK